MKHLFIHIPFIIINIVHLFLIIYYGLLYWILAPLGWFISFVWHFNNPKTNLIEEFKEFFLDMLLDLDNKQN